MTDSSIIEDRGGELKRSQNTTDPSPSRRWKSEKEQKLYTSKLLEAFRHVVRSNPNPAPSLPPRGRAVREAADRALAVAARGRTRWSRAILASRSIKLKSQRRKRSAGPARTKSSVANVIASSSSIRKPLAPVQRKARLLGRLVPGCRSLSFPAILEETTDYIPALEMQVRVMSAIYQILSGLGSGADGCVVANRIF